MNGAKIVKKIIDLIHVFTSLIFHFQFSIFNFILAVPSPLTAPPSGFPLYLLSPSLPLRLQKDAAPIPNALGGGDEHRAASHELSLLK